MRAIGEDSALANRVADLLAASGEQVGLSSIVLAELLVGVRPADRARLIRSDATDAGVDGRGGQGTRFAPGGSRVDWARHAPGGMGAHGPLTRSAMPRPLARRAPYALALAAALMLPAARDAGAQDRFAAAIAGAPESTVRNGYVVNHRREAVQREITARPPTEAELGVRLPPGARLLPEVTARQIAQYHPGWRIFQYRVAMSRDELGRFFAEQGLRYEPSEGRAYFPGATNQRGDFIDGLAGASGTGIRIWRMPPEGTAARP